MKAKIKATIECPDDWDVDMVSERLHDYFPECEIWDTISPID